LRKTQDEIQRFNVELEQRVADRTAQLETANTELAAFSYSVSHDLRAPLRAIDGFSQALLDESGDRLDETGRRYLERVRKGAQRMAELIDDLLSLSQVSRKSLERETVDLSEIAAEAFAVLARAEPNRKVAFEVARQVTGNADEGLIRIVLQNLIGNAWKFTARRGEAEIEFGVRDGDGGPCYFVRDNGAGFDMAYADKLFGAFQRLHAAGEFPGTGIGLAIVARIIHRHGGKVGAEGRVDEGATFWFTL
jgi:light-regulated signal transduction histidine kinase (bacteriophytochrome)